MAQLQKKFIAPNAVDGSKIALLNNEALRARNAADSAYVNLLYLSPSDVLTLSSVPEVGSDAITPNGLVRLSQLDARLQGLKPKEAVRVASTANVASISGLLTIDGVVTVAGDRVLLKDQTDAKENGIYVVAAGAWARDVDMDVSAEFKGSYTVAYGGVSQIGRGFVCTVDSSFVLGTDNATFVLFTAAGSYVAGNGIDITGSTISVALAATPGLEFSSAALRVKAGPGIKLTASGVEPNLEASNPSLQVSANELGVKINSSGGLQKLAGGLGVKVDTTSVKINASNEVQSLQRKREAITLNGTDITNQYVDLAVVAVNASDVEVSPVGGIEQENAVDFTVSLTGGVAGVTRVSFAGDLATGGDAALISGDKLVIHYKTWA